MDKVIGFEDIGTEKEVNPIALARRLAQHGGVILKENEKFKLKTKNRVRGESDEEDQ